MINIHNEHNWVCATNAIDVFHITKIETKQYFTTGQPYVICAETEEALMAKIFVNPTRDEETEEFEIDQFVPREESYIIAQAHYIEGEI